MQRVQDQHMIGLLARTDGANRTILVNMMKPGLLKAPIWSVAGWSALAISILSWSGHQNSQIGNDSLKFLASGKSGGDGFRFGLVQMSCTHT